MKTIIFEKIICVLILLLFAVAAHSAPQGIYTTDSQNSIDAKALALPYVDGALIRTHWLSSNPAQNNYDFSALCKKLAAVQAVGKKASLVTYMDAPAWVMSQIPASETLVSPLFGGLQPVPWSATAQKHMQTFINAQANFVCDGYPLKTHPAVVNIDAGIIGIQAIRQAPTYELNTMLTAINWGVDAWYAAFGDNHTFYNALFPIGSTKAKVTDAIAIRDSILANHPKHAFFQETYTGSGPSKGDLATVLAPNVANRTFPVMLQACGIWSNTKAIPCNFSTPDSPEIAYNNVAKLYQTKYFEFYPADLLYANYKTMFEAIHSDVWKDVVQPPPPPPPVPDPEPNPCDPLPPPDPTPIPDPQPLPVTVKEIDLKTAIKNAWVTPTPASLPAGAKHLGFHSVANNADTSYLVYLPPDYATSAKTYPVLYWFHGINGSEITTGAWLLPWFDKNIRSGAIDPVIVVIPTGAKTSMWMNETGSALKAESMVIDELVPLIDSKFRTTKTRDGRWLEGFSMGGFGAARFALKYPELFSSVVTYAGAFGAPEVAAVDNAKRPDALIPVYAKSAKFSLYPIKWRQVVGTSDLTLQWNRTTNAILKVSGIAYEYQEVPGYMHRDPPYLDGFGVAGVNFH
ncbi:MAG: esterase family protein [Methylobacter sp.]|uniref:alpha/beta hydrolase n=1 Tax=Methylobacter sp. TaxID=2051955 RepID=UPI0025EEB840|nr:alpha/beta hydrolase-fold protein [Methylobacter sp.]MCK9622232.1 esterase family protein [Methylobacter sp.]